jgi:hypothetical protein
MVDENHKAALSSQEEFFESQPTGVELEDETPPAAKDPEPWDPEQIRIHTKHYSLRQLVDMIADGDVDLAPDFQRQYVWKDWQRWGLIESLLLGVPLPSFYFNEDPDGRLQVVDGVQRLTTIYNFVRAKSFRLGSLTYLHDLEGRDFDKLDGAFRRRLLGAQFVAHVIDPQTPYRVKFDIFRRINTGGSPLSAQEIRHCMSGEQSRAFLKKLADDKDFIAATGASLHNHPRMADREVALRSVAFRLFSVDDYAKSGTLDDFLGKATERIDSELSETELHQIHQTFSRGMRHAKLAFGDYAFRKWPRDADRRNPINRALVETWGTVLADFSEARVIERQNALARRARDLMTDDLPFIGSIAGSTGDPANVRERFTKVRAVATEVLT